MANIPIGTPIQFIGEYADAMFQLLPGQIGVVVSGDGIHQTWWLRCPCGSGGILSNNIINSTNPINIESMIECPGGCRYLIKDGRIA